jgi:hypothetical protein
MTGGKAYCCNKSEDCPPAQLSGICKDRPKDLRTASIGAVESLVAFASAKVVVLHVLLCSMASAQTLSVTSCGADSTGKTDSTVAFEKCLRSLSAGDLMIPYGTYRLTRPIFKNRNQNLIGMGSKASILQCETPESACIVAADTVFGPNNYSVSAIQNLGIVGPGVDSKGTGVLIGGDPEGKVIAKSAYGDSVNLTDVLVKAFHHGVEWGNNAYANKLFHCAINENTVGLFTPKGIRNSGESISITDSNIFNNRTSGIEDHANFEWMIQGTSFDYNATAFVFFGGAIHLTNCHFEQQGAQVFLQPYGQAILSIRDSEILVQSGSGQDKYILSLWPQSLSLTIDDVSIWSNHPVQYFMRVQGEIAGTIANLHGNGNHKIGALSDTASHAEIAAIQAF